MASGYDSGEITDRERQAATNQKDLAGWNADTVKRQHAQQMGIYDMADQQNRRLADVQLIQNSRKTEADRFEAQRDLQNAALGLFGSMGNAMNGSTLGNTMYMLGDRNDKENQTYWNQLQQNQNAVENAYDESVNQNNVARNQASSNAEASLRGLEGDLAANLNNINPNLYESPSGTYSDGFYDANKVEANMAKLAGYLIPEGSIRSDTVYNSRNKVGGNSYFARLMNKFNGRR